MLYTQLSSFGEILWKGHITRGIKINIVQTKPALGVQAWAWRMSKGQESLTLSQRGTGERCSLMNKCFSCWTIFGNTGIEKSLSCLRVFLDFWVFLSVSLVRSLAALQSLAVFRTGEKQYSFMLTKKRRKE